MKKNGFIHLYYGNGKGKTSILNGSAIRAISQNLNVCYLSFFKNFSNNNGEFNYFKNELKNKIKFKSFYKFSDKFIWNMSKSEILQLKKESIEGLKYFEEIIKNRNWDLVIGDELIDVITNKFISEKELYDILNKKASNVEIMISGHILPKNANQMFDLITELKMIKHYFNEGILARKGIEY